MSQIEGFKLHVTQIVKPFVGKVRYAPEVASRPERLSKDLANAKELVTVLEEEAASLRSAMSATTIQPTNGENTEANSNAAEDAAMADVAGDQYEEDPEPQERGSDAIERRVEKIISDLREQGQFAGNSDDEVEAKRVSRLCTQERIPPTILMRFVDFDCTGPVPRVSSYSVSHMLLLRRSYGSCRGIAAQMCEACKKTSAASRKAGVQSSGCTQPRGYDRRGCEEGR